MRLCHSLLKVRERESLGKEDIPVKANSLSPMKMAESY